MVSAMMGGGYMRRMQRRPHGEPVKPQEEVRRNDAQARERSTMYDELMAKHGFIPMNHVAPQFFPVKEDMVYDAAGKPVPGYKRIERPDTGDTLAIHSDKYTLSVYERHFDAFEKAIAASPLKDQRVMVGTDLADNGAKLFRQYLFPDMLHEIVTRTGQKRDIAFRIAMFDSYDGSSAFFGKSGFFDFTCANKAMFGLTLAEFKARHLGEMDGRIDAIIGELVKAGTEFDRQMSRMGKWTGVKLIAEQVEALTNALPQGNKGLTAQLTVKWAKQPDDSLWGLHTVLTDWATHAESGGPVPVKTSIDRSKRITTLVEGRDWKVLEPA